MNSFGNFIALIIHDQRAIFYLRDITTSEHLAFLAEMLTGFYRVEIDSSIKSQKRLTASRTIRSTYPWEKSKSD